MGSYAHTGFVDGPLMLGGESGQVEAQISYPKGYQPGQPVAVVCHPHPLYGGSMDNKVVYMLGKSLLQLGAAVLRFNFRGVGASEGSFDHGDGESEDLLSIVAWLRQQHPDSPLWLAGFSFGSYVAYRSALSLAPARLLLVAPPVSMYDFTEYSLPEALPWLVIQGGEDEIVDPQAVRQWLSQQALPPALCWLDGADHFFHGRLIELKEAVLSFWG